MVWTKNAILTRQIFYYLFSMSNSKVQVMLFCLTPREEIFDCIEKLKNDRASGEDGIINEYIKSTAHQFINIYEKLFNLIFDCGIIPENWVIGKIKPIYKNKGDSSEPKNYRPITILSCLGKLFTSVLCNRLKICTASTLLMLSFLLGLHMLDAYSRLGRTKVV